MITNTTLKNEILQKIKCFYNKKAKEIFIIVGNEYAINLKIGAKEKRFMVSNEKAYLRKIQKQKVSIISLETVFEYLFKDWENEKYTIPACVLQSGTVLVEEFSKAIIKINGKRKSIEPPKPCCHGG